MRENNIERDFERNPSPENFEKLFNALLRRDFIPSTYLNRAIRENDIFNIAWYARYEKVDEEEYRSLIFRYFDDYKEDEDELQDFQEAIKAIAVIDSDISWYILKGLIKPKNMNNKSVARAEEAILNLWRLSNKDKVADFLRDYIISDYFKNTSRNYSRDISLAAMYIMSEINTERSRAHLLEIIDETNKLHVACDAFKAFDKERYLGFLFGNEYIDDASDEEAIEIIREHLKDSHPSPVRQDIRLPFFY